MPGVRTAGPGAVAVFCRKPNAIVTRARASSTSATMCANKKVRHAGVVGDVRQLGEDEQQESVVPGSARQPEPDHHQCAVNDNECGMRHGCYKGTKTAPRPRPGAEPRARASEGPGSSRPQLNNRGFSYRPGGRPPGRAGRSPLPRV